MFFVFSKVLWFATAPANLLLLALVAGALLLCTGHLAPGRLLVAAAAVAFFACGLLPTGTLLLRGLESRFPLPDLAGVTPTGIVVLGGPIDQVVSAARGQVAMGDGATRLTEGAALARRFPEARLLYTGGSNALIAQEGDEAGQARALWIALGVPADRILTESRSRNTYENAVFSRDLVRPKPGEAWLLVTSAYHMPRAVGLFRAAGFPVVPYPVDFRTIGDRRDLEPARDAAAGLMRFDMAVREWIGLAAYRLAGRTRDLFPGP